MKIFISEFADTKQGIEYYLGGHIMPIIEHLLKLYLMPNHTDANHWKSEIFTQINSVNKLKSNKKFPSSKQLYSWTYLKKQDCVTDIQWLTKLVSEICWRYSIEFTFDMESLAKRFDRICESYFRWLSEELSMCGMVNDYEVHEVIDTILGNQI